MIVYFKCLCKSRDKVWANKLKATYNAEIRVTDWNPEYRAEAKKYGLKLPFIVENGEARPLYE